MTRQRQPTLWRLWGLLLLVWPLVGCNQTEARPAPTEVLPTSAAEPVAIPTPIPLPSATTTPGPETWDYVALGDCIPAGWGVSRSYVDMYAEYIAQDLNVDVVVHNLSNGANSTAGLLGQLRHDEDVRAAIREAEVVTVWVGSVDVDRLLYSVPAKCGAMSDLDLDCVRAGEQGIEENLDAILTELRSLRSADDALVLIADGCNWWVQYWQAAGVFEQLKGPAFDDWSHAISDLAVRHAATVVHSHTLCNGPEGKERVDTDYLLPTEWFHFNEAGHRLIAELHRAAGYEHGQ